MLTSIFVSTIPPRIQALAVLASISLLAIVIHLIRREKLKEGYSIIWFLLGAVLVVFSLFTKLLDGLSALVGIHYSPATLFLLLTGGLFLLALHFSVLISKHDRRIKELAQENALLKHQLEGRTTPKLSSGVSASIRMKKGERVMSVKTGGK